MTTKITELLKKKKKQSTSETIMRRLCSLDYNRNRTVNTTQEKCSTTYCSHTLTKYSFSSYKVLSTKLKDNLYISYLYSRNMSINIRTFLHLNI